jgi:plastocyanin
MGKIRRSRWFGFWCLTGSLVPLAAPVGAQEVSSISGRVTILEKGDHPTDDVAQTVIWLTGTEAPAAQAEQVEMATEGKQFVPRMVVLGLGSSVTFPNHDPFNHNVFSLSPEGSFDLGLYGRGQAKSATFNRPGIVRVYCNVHAQMRGLVLVLESALHTQPGGDGSFQLDGVPPGNYTLHAWHERGGESTQPLKVTGRALAPVAITLDARGYRLVQHKDKNGQSYSDRSRRY